MSSLFLKKYSIIFFAFVLFLSTFGNALITSQDAKISPNNDDDYEDVPCDEMTETEVVSTPKQATDTNKISDLIKRASNDSSVENNDDSKSIPTGNETLEIVDTKHEDTAADEHADQHTNPDDGFTGTLITKLIKLFLNNPRRGLKLLRIN